MRLSNKGDYGIRALIDLAQHQGHGPIPSGEIAARQLIPESLIGQVLASLRTGGFARSVRGAQGGHELARDPEEIRMDEVVEALEGPITPSACVQNPELASAPGSQAQLPLWLEVRDAIRTALNGHTLADLAREQANVGGGRYVI